MCASRRRVRLPARVLWSPRARRCLLSRCLGLPLELPPSVPARPPAQVGLLPRCTRDLCRSLSGQSHRWGSALQRLRPQTGERFGPWALKRGRRRSAPAGRDTPRGSPRVPQGCPERGEPARLSHVPCVTTGWLTSAAFDAKKGAQGLRRGRCRAARTADAPPGLPHPYFYPPGLPQHTQAVAATASKPHDALKNKYAPQSTSPRLGPRDRRP